MRWIRNVFAMIAIVSMMLWIASYFVFINAYGPYWKTDSRITFAAAWGCVGFGAGYGWPPNYLPKGWNIDFVSMKERRPGMILYGKGYVNTPMKYEPHFMFDTNTSAFQSQNFKLTNIRTPLWLPTLLFGLWPAVTLTRHIKRRYFTPGVCRKCGYDLRGTPSGVCPECGHGAAVESQ